jgi:hypothetical protein
MAFDNTITELDMDATTSQYVGGIQTEVAEREADLDIDGMTDSLLGRVLGLFTPKKS